MLELTKLYPVLGYSFNNQALLLQALTHRSFAAHNNERLEFLGDAILSYVVAQLLYRTYPHADEGELSRYRANIVKGESLAKKAQALQLGDYLRLGIGELKSGGHKRPSILADAMEAIIGAIYLDGEIGAITQVIEKLFADNIAQVKVLSYLKDPKTRLQEYLQSHQHPLPDYRLIATQGEQHEQTFVVQCEVSSLGLQVTAEGGSRRRAEQAAASALFVKLESELEK